MSLDHRIVMPPAEEFQGLSPEELPKGLEGLVVVELGDYVAMPACTRALGEMGATVYKIETIKGNLHRGDGVGFGMPELGPDNPAFDMSNANKKFLSIDMKSDGGRELVEKLLEQADVFVTSLRNPSLKRLGYDYETLHARYPRLVYGQMRGYGERGEMKDARALTPPAIPPVAACLCPSRRLASTSSQATCPPHSAISIPASPLAWAS